MPIVRWTPFRELENMFDDDFLMPIAKRFGPAIDIYEDGDNVVAEASLPGVDPKDVDVTVENDILTIQGQSKSEQEQKLADEQRAINYYRKEVRSGSFHRTVQLPYAVNGDQAKATYENGILKISIPKAEHAKAKKITIETR